MKPGWTHTTLMELFDFKYGKGLPKKRRTLNGPVNVYGSNGCIGKHDSPLTDGPTIIIGRKGSVGEIHLSSVPCWPIDTTYYVDKFYANLPINYWKLFLQALKLGQHDKSSAIPGLSRDDIYKALAPLPPLPEQHRIVAKLKKLLHKVDDCKERLEKIPAILKRFRKSVLTAACSGRLTADWRETQGVDNGVDLPEGWKRVKLGALMQDHPKNGLYKPQTDYGKGILILRIDNFYDGVIASWAELKRVNVSEHEANQFALANDDIIVNRVNSIKFLGKSALVRNLSEPCVFESNMMRFRFDHSKVLPEYGILYMNSFEGLKELRKNAKHAVNQSSINQGDVQSTFFNLPSLLPEQHEIVRRVEALFAVADRIEERYKKAKVQVDKLTQSILAKAFRGDLVPQDPNDEPASMLLERIKAERAEMEAGQKRKKKTAGRKRGRKTGQARKVDKKSVKDTS